MIRLIIAEDEALERKALRSLVEAEFSKSIEIIAECATGRTFLETALELDPDLMLVDIEMPEMSGLEALNLLRENGLSGEALILTAYSEFDYARLAVKYQAADYLLKPISRRNFSESIRKSMERIDKKKQEVPGRNQRSQERELIWRLRHPGPEFRTNLNELSQILKMKNTPFYFHSLPLARRSGRPLLLSLKTRFDGMGCDCFGACIAGAAELIIQSREGEISPGKILNALEDNNQDSTLLPEPLLLGPHTDFGDLVREINEKSLRERESPWVPGSLSRVSLERSLGDDLVEGRLHLIHGKLANLFQYKKAVAGPGEARSYALELITVIDRRLISLFAVRFDSLDPEVLTPRLNDFSETGEVLEILDSLFCDVSRQIRQTHRTREQRLVGEIRAFLEDHSGEPPSLQEVSDRLKKSPSYISRCFRRVTGLSYKEFQIMHRMEMAKELLLTPGMTVADAAAATGFADPNYFSKAFKRETGLSPRAYADGESYK
ncbi:helix-turn-helix domain-containing protein [Oceanispirochaeta sp.]|jgi:two-component system response regulator YesN|uniref:helix-turn-helix domain-containing protein n=1 Tax=Oceanispirochaeta sp. TaxID=2035350 RepID=UPI002615A299|nr:helix-turn-helix domain-containing protein [Oceanispirochaeta sp.]MDA3955102.1 helix-turn-helix domain-containing protein [Oceanispirochaeta sp.]